MISSSLFKQQRDTVVTCLCLGMNKNCRWILHIFKKLLHGFTNDQKISRKNCCHDTFSLILPIFPNVILLMNYSPARKQSKRTDNDQMTTNQTTNSKANRSIRSKTEQVYEQYFPKPAKKKFVQHSIFLPLIQTKQKANRNNQYRSQRQTLKSRDDSKFREDEILISDSQQQSTMEYINECQKIIENLKKLTTISTNKLERKKPLLNSRNQSNERGRNYTLNLEEFSENQNGQKLRRDRTKTGKRTDNEDNYEQKGQIRIKSSFNQRDDDLMKTSMKLKNSNVKINQKKSLKDPKDNQASPKNDQLSQEDLKNQQQLKKAQRKQKFLMKFLNKAKDRGCELHKKIAQFKMKKNEQKQQQVNQSQASPTKQKQESTKQKKNTKQQKQQKNPETTSKESTKKIPSVQKVQESPSKLKKK